MKGPVMERIIFFMVGSLFIGGRALELIYDVVHLGIEGINGIFQTAQIIFEVGSIIFDVRSIIFEGRVLKVQGRNI